MPSGGLLRDAAALLLRMRAEGIRIGRPGTRPARTALTAKIRCSYFVLDNKPNLGYNLRISAQRGARSRGVVIVEPGAVLRMRLTQVLRQEAARTSFAGKMRCPPKKAVREEPFGSSLTHTIEPDASSRPLDLIPSEPKAREVTPACSLKRSGIRLAQKPR